MPSLQSSGVESPADLDSDVAAPLVEWAKKNRVSIPAWLITVFNQCQMVESLTALYGLHVAIKG